MIDIMPYSDWIGYVFLLIGFGMISFKIQTGFAITAIGSGIMVFFGLHFEHYGVVGANIIFLILAVIGYFGHGMKKNEIHIS